MRINELVVSLLSAGVIASLVAGIFSIVIAIKNNKAIKELEQLKIRNEKQEQLYKTIYSARNELLNILPAEKRMNVSITALERPFLNDDLADLYVKFKSICIDNQKVIWTHFDKYRPYFSRNECDQFDEKNTELVRLAYEMDNTQNEISLIKSKWADWLSQLEKYYRKEPVNEDIKRMVEYNDYYFKSLKSFIVATVDLEQWYFDLFEQYIRSYTFIT